jgi:septum formation protein
VNSALLLASNSPRRRELLAAARFDFATVAPQISEKFDVDLTVRELTTFNAIRKGMSVALAHPGKIVLAADTLVALRDEIIGKPANLDEAVDMLRRLSGRQHEVCSAVFICHLPRPRDGESVRLRTRSTSFYEISRVYFRRLSDSAIRGYVDKINPLDKAGAYAAQGDGQEIIERIEGSYTNVVGLPMERTIAALAQFGIKPTLA